MNFPKSARVRKRREYLNFFHQSEVKRLGSCIVFRIKNKSEFARLGITVKSKTTSVLRNHIKRQIRETFRQNRAQLGAFDYNIVVPSQVKVDYRTATRVRESLEKIWAHEAVF